MKKLIRILLVTLALVVCANVAVLNWQMLSVENRLSFSEYRAQDDEQVISWLTQPTADVVQDRIQSVVKVQVFTGQVDPITGRTIATFGSGVIINSSGIILTARHIVENMLVTERSSGCVTLTDGTNLVVTMFAVDPNADLALLKVDPNGTELTAVHLGVMPDVGDPVWLVGNPCHLEFLVSKGVVSKVMLPSREGNTIISDVTLNPGNSGGPLFDRNGRIVGIAQGFVSPGHFSVGLSFIVGVDVIRRDFCKMYLELMK